MSQANVDVVRRLVWDGVDAARLIRDDTTSYWAELEAIVEPDCAFGWIGPFGRIEATGLDEAREFWLDWFEPWESMRADVERIFLVGDKVVLLARHHGRMAGTKHEVEAMVAGVYLVRDGRLARADFYSDRAEALEAVGLRERSARLSLAPLASRGPNAVLDATVRAADTGPAMSQHLVAELRNVYAEWANGNFRAGLELLDPDILFETFTGDEGPVRARGLDELQERLRQTFHLVWAQFTVEADDFIEVEDKIVVIGRMRGRGRGSGVNVDGPVFMVWTFRDGSAVCQQWFDDRTEALEAAGLRQEARSRENAAPRRYPAESRVMWPPTWKPP